MDLSLCRGTAEPGADLLPVDLARTRRFLCPVRPSRNHADRHAGRCLTVPFLRLQDTAMRRVSRLVFCLWKRIAVAAQQRSAVLDAWSGALDRRSNPQYQRVLSPGQVGVFYGNKFGYPTRWVRKFPFSCLRHPQYIGALLSIWGFFLVMRFPQDDWYLLPALETLYYVLGAYWEQ